ncbi:hypothetical protein AWC01_02835 [Mycobacterium doricum]|uniref:Uncharacterized protein n=1 Tax=Mycolicibacterium doricum TaxID=126673 RepID=A0A1X1TJH1_9MYCO|nr:hypothetical protein AWC01_02835 [Mycolicibacterium doricum]
MLRVCGTRFAVAETGSPDWAECHPAIAFQMLMGSASWRTSPTPCTLLPYREASRRRIRDVSTVVER